MFIGTLIWFNLYISPMSADMLAVNQLGAIVYRCESLQFEPCINLSLNLDQNVMNIMVF